MRKLKYSFIQDSSIREVICGTYHIDKLVLMTFKVEIWGGQNIIPLNGKIK